VVKENTITFNYIPLKQNYPKEFSNPFLSDDEDSEIESEITFRIYAGESRDEHIKYNSYHNVSIVGNLPKLSEGAEYTIIAIEEEKNNEPQYKVISVKRKRPMNNIGVRLFLAEMLTPNQVDQIMTHYPNIIDIISEGKINTIDLTKLYGIGEYIIKVIERKILENFKFAEIIAEFDGMLNFDILKKLYEKYTSVEEIKQEIKNNPYECLTDLNRVGFKTADKIILNFDKECKKKIKKDEEVPILFDYDILTSQQRTSACVQYILLENESNGHTKMLTESLVKEVKSLAPECFSNVLEVLKNKTEYILKKPYIARREVYETEEYIANIIKEALKKENQIKWEFDIKKYQDDFGLTDEQFSMLKNVCDNNISILNGSAGSGKSFTISALIKMLKDNKIWDYRLSAPTGKSAKVIKAYTNEYASTVHLMLGAKGNNYFDYNENNKLYADIIFIDEFSMMDIFLMKHLLEAVDITKTKLVFIGDAAQLPSVSCGNVFHDLLESNIPKTTLTKVFRYGIGGISTVATNTRLCKETIKDKDAEKVVLGDDKAYVYFNMNQERVIKTVLLLYKKLLENNSPEDISILTSYNKGEYGTVALNNQLQLIANPRSKQSTESYLKIFDTKYYIDDIIMQNVNNYKACRYECDVITSLRAKNHTFICNGDTGKIIDIDFEKKIAIIKFDNETVVYTAKQLCDCKLSYSYSTHKSQGSQNKNIILLTPKAHTYMLNSNLIYVGLTRATDRVYHFGELDTINRAIKIKENFNRLTFLQDFIK